MSEACGKTRIRHRPFFPVHVPMTARAPAPSIRGPRWCALDDEAWRNSSSALRWQTERAGSTTWPTTSPRSDPRRAGAVVHRKGAMRAFPPGWAEIPRDVSERPLLETVADRGRVRATSRRFELRCFPEPEQWELRMAMVRPGETITRNGRSSRRSSEQTRWGATWRPFAFHVRVTAPANGL